MPFSPSLCFELVSYILVLTEYLSKPHVTDKRSSLSVVVSLGVCYCTEFDLVSSFLPCGCLLFSLLLACSIGS